MKAADVMTRDVKVVEPDASIRHAAKLMDDLDVGVIPVCNGRRLVGMITDRDMAVRALAAGLGPDTRVGEVMTDQVAWCFDDDTVEDVESKMRGLQVRRIPIVDRDKNLIGIIALGDLSTDEVPGVGRTLREISEPSEPDLSRRGH